MSDPDGRVIPGVRPNWRAVLAALLVAGLLMHPVGFGFAALAGLLVLVLSGIYETVALLGYIAGGVVAQDVLAEDEPDGR